MAEIVQRRAENSIRELEMYRQLKVMSDEMINGIIVMRRNLDVKTNNNHSKNVEDFKSYIAHEEMVLEKIRKARVKLNKNDVNRLEQIIIDRIQRLYENALQYYPSEFTLYEGLCELCKKYRRNCTTTVIDNMIKMFSHRTEVWKIAAEWYIQNDNYEQAFKTLDKGLTNNPKSTLLYDAAIEMELKMAQKESKQVQQNEKRLFRENQCCNKISTYIDLILKYMDELGYLIEILGKLEKHSFTSKLQDFILDHLYRKYNCEPIVWHTLAKRERKGIHFVTDQNEAPRNSNFTKSCIRYCRDKYEQGLRHISIEKKSILWSYCLETFIELYEDREIGGFNTKKECLIELFQKASADRCLNEHHYCFWIERLLTDKDEIKKILQEALELHPKSEALWKLNLKIAIVSDKLKDVETIFEEGRKALKSKSLSLWLTYVRYNLLISSSERMHKIFEDAINEDDEISTVFKTKYLQWVAFHEGIDAARATYRKIALEEPFSKELHNFMSKLELTEITVNNANVEKILEIACQQFGKEDIDVWLNLTKFILANKSHNVQDKLDKLLKEAKRTLPVLMWDRYKEMYEQLLIDIN